MKTLESSFFALEWSGMWRPVHLLPGWKAKLYDTFTWLSVFILATFTIAQLIGVLNSMDDIEALANNVFVVLTCMAEFGKAVNILIKRDEIIELTNSLQQNPFLPRSEDEITIQRKFDYRARFNIVRFATVTWLAAFLIVCGSLTEYVSQRSLPINVWLPFRYDTPLGFWIAYGHQFFGAWICCGVGVSFDTFVSALMLQICAQLNILKHRFLEMPQMSLEMTHKFRNEDSSNLFTLNAESMLLSNCVKHHLQIFKFAEKLNDLFGLMIFLQYTASTIIICACFVDLSRMKIFSPVFTVLLIYIVNMSLQILMYCFYGGEVTIESINLCDGIYEMDWTGLSVHSKRSLLTIMARTTRPIKFTSAHILTMNLESFKSLLKLSYSTFNVLQSTQK